MLCLKYRLPMTTPTSRSSERTPILPTTYGSGSLNGRNVEEIRCGEKCCVCICETVYTPAQCSACICIAAIITGITLFSIAMSRMDEDNVNNTPLYIGAGVSWLVAFIAMTVFYCKSSTIPIDYTQGGIRYTGYITDYRKIPAEVEARERGREMGKACANCCNLV